MGADSNYRLTLSGIAHTEARGSLFKVTEEARGFALRGYRPCIHNRKGSVVEIKRVPDGFVLSWHPSGTDDNENAQGSSEPVWLELVRKHLASRTSQGEQL